MSAFADFTAAHRELIATLGDPATYAPVVGAPGVVQALLDRNSLELGEYGQTVAVRPAVSVLLADVPRPERGDLITFTDPVTGVITSTWRVVRPATVDDIVAQLWVESA